MNTLEMLLFYKELNQANSKLIENLAGLVIQGAGQLQVETVDSHVLLEILNDHNQTVKKINEKFFGEANANVGLSK